MFLVSGASGTVGSEVVGALLRAGAPVRGLVRSSERELPDGAEAVVGDLNDPPSLRAALAGVSGVFLLAGYADMPGLLAEIAGAGVRSVVLLSGGGAGASDLDNAISRYQVESERVVREAGVPWTILRPYAFMSNALRWLPQLHEGDVLRLAFADVASAIIDPGDIGAVAARALISGDHAGRTHALSGPQALLPAEQAAILGRALGRPLRVEPLS
ncbi:MAG: SDR family oxidoreductase, partial [Solirubrobacteraceae bacterium]